LHGCTFEYHLTSQTSWLVKGTSVDSWDHCPMLLCQSKKLD
jgi:hypothetical protein